MRKRGGLGDIAEASPHSCGEEITRRQPFGSSKALESIFRTKSPLEALENLFGTKSPLRSVHTQAMLVAGFESPVKGLKALEVDRVRAQATLGAQATRGPPFSAKKMFDIFYTEPEKSLGLILPTYTWTPRDSSLMPEGCANSSGRRLVGQGTKWSSHANIYFWSLGELQSLGVYCDVLGGVVHTQSEDLTWLTYMSEASLFTSLSFRSLDDIVVVKSAR
ncbi:hypothetical protein GW17_00029676 [Ensete ventricosum]|nr:hypothetical protein GW17_00029676 [Ensete ventricosum]